MPNEAIVSPAPPGAGRATDFYLSEWKAGAQNFLGRIGQDYGGFLGTTNYAIAAPNDGGSWGTGPYSAVNPMRVGQLEAYSVVPGAPLSFLAERPGARFRWPLGRHVFGGLFSWNAAPPATGESGLMIGPIHTRVLNNSNGSFGILLGNVGGKITLSTRGPGGFEQVDCSAFQGPLNSWNKLALILRAATYDADASVEAWVNDQLAAKRTWAAGHKLPYPGASPQGGYAGCFYLHLQHVTNASVLKYQQVFFQQGPDVLGGTE